MKFRLLGVIVGQYGNTFAFITRQIHSMIWTYNTRWERTREHCALQWDCDNYVENWCL